MIKILKILFFLSFSCSYAQLTELKLRKSNIENSIKNLEDSLRSVNIQITRLTNREFLNAAENSKVTAIAKRNSKLVESSNASSKTILINKKDIRVRVLGYEKSYYKICQDSICGYMHEVYLQPDKINTFKSNYSYKPSTNSRINIRGPRGGCYYINSNGKKTYVDRSFCN